METDNEKGIQGTYYICPICFLPSSDMDLLPEKIWYKPNRRQIRKFPMCWQEVLLCPKCKDRYTWFMLHPVYYTILREINDLVS